MFHPVRRGWFDVKKGSFALALLSGLCVAALFPGYIGPVRAETAPPATETHRVVPGDTIRGILLAYNCVSSMATYGQLRDEFARLNPDAPYSGALMEGQEVTVPRFPGGGACLRESTERVVRVEFETGTISETVRVYLDGPVLPDLFMLKNQSPHRLVCDFDGTLPGEGLPREITTHGRLVQKIRVGHEDKPFRRARVVLDLVDPLIGTVEQYFFEQESMLVLTVHEAF